MKRTTAAVASLILCIVIGGCTSLLNPLREDRLEPSKVLELDASAPIASQMGVGDRMALRSVQDSPQYKMLSDSFLPGSTPHISRPKGREYAVILSLKPDKGMVFQEFEINVYPYVVFVLDPITKELVEVCKATPSIDSGTLLVESLLQDETYTSEMSPCVLAELSQASQMVSRAWRGDRRLAPKYECDESLTEPKTTCWCTETVPGHYNTGCISDCLSVCEFAPFPPVCIAVCMVACWVPAYCVEIECQTIYPCPW